MTDEYGIVPSTGEYGNDWPANHVLPQGKGGSISVGGWTEENEGFVQQTFLGASITNFDISAGFGDTSSQLRVDLVDDEFNKSDGLFRGSGDDVYHNGIRDQFLPPVVGAPVFFKFGKNFATIEQAYRKTLDDTYGYNTVPDIVSFNTTTTNGEITEIPGDHFVLRSSTGNGASQVNTWVDQSPLWDYDNISRGKDHFAFGGILQSYVQNRGPNGNPLYSVNVVDPREILSNASVILDNYQGTTFNNKNLYNVYGFLEYDPSDELLEELEGTDTAPNPDLIEKRVLKKNVDGAGIITYTGDDMYEFQDKAFSIDNFPSDFPITGQGFSRRGDNGIPWYRVNQALTALFNFNGTLPEEYVNAGFGGTIDFRGYKYIADFGGIPLERIPQMYFMDFGKMTLMDIAQELADVISHDLFISLLPVIDHPAFKWLYNQNQYYINNGENEKVVAGVIRIDAIDRSQQPDYGSIKRYIDDLGNKGIAVENQDIGYELSNVTTDKFVVGANEVDMFYFSNQRDRNNLQLTRKNNGMSNDYEYMEEVKWEMETSLKQQILPFYGFLGKDAVSIPRGFGSYQQIMLDTQGLGAYGVGNYYIATELELRIAMKGYEDWSKFLADYNEIYVEDLAADKAFYKAQASIPIDNLDAGGIDQILSQYTTQNRESLQKLANGNYGVTVPRCVFNSDKNYMGPDNLPASPCSPPYGYPLYYKRAEKIGIARAGAAAFSDAYLQLQSNYDSLQARIKEKRVNDDIVNTDQNINDATNQVINASLAEVASLSPTALETLINSSNQASAIASEYNLLVGEAVKTANYLQQYSSYYKAVKDIGLDGDKNAKKVYEFLKQVADQNLGKKFLVKIPKSCNLSYAGEFVTDQQEIEIEKGPFGFKPQPINSDAGYSETDEFKAEIDALAVQVKSVGGPAGGAPRELFNHYLDVNANVEYTYGALKNNFNPISEKWEFNYVPATDGGFFNFALYNRNLSFSESASLPDAELPLATKHILAPKDLSNIVDFNGRMKSYVRFNHSQFLNMDTIPSESIAQQARTRNGFIPDVLEELDNVNTDDKSFLDRINEMNAGTLPETVAFVTCDLDPKFYLTPKIVTEDVTVFGRAVKWVQHERPVDLQLTRDEDGCLIATPVIEDHWKVFSPSAQGGSTGATAPNTDFKRVYNPVLDALIVDTEKQNLDPDHVYALITLPGRIKPFIDSRYLDGDAYTYNAADIKHNLTQDVTRGPAGFDSPPAAVNRNEFSYTCPEQDVYRTPFGIKEAQNIFDLDRKIELGYSYIERQNAAFSAGVRAQRNAFAAAKGGNLAFNVSKSQPSPVYPDMVALALRSNERCYGPWLSTSIIDGNSTVRYTDIGGAVEFVKDENLAPWNFAGYQLMNEAGSLQAQFSNSLLLFTERGGFVIPEAPTGISIAAALNQGGPLVTSISVGVSEGGIKTTVKMDLYTSRFGKLQKQKEELIAKVSRERQRIIDQNNKLLKQGLIKNSTSNVDLLGPIRGIGELIKDIGQSTADRIEGEMIRSNQLKFTSNTHSKNVRPVDENGDVGELTTVNKKTNNAHMTSPERESDLAGNRDSVAGFREDEVPFDFTEVYVPAAQQPSPTWPSIFNTEQSDRESTLNEQADFDNE